MGACRRAFLTLELTESFLMADSGRSLAVLDAACPTSACGCRSTTSAPGTPRCRYLKRLPIEEIKIDRSFVMQMHDDANDAMIVRATVDLGRNLGLRVVAEGVEDLATFDRLADFGCDEAQGYYISQAGLRGRVHAVAFRAEPRCCAAGYRGGVSPAAPFGRSDPPDLVAPT